MVKTKEFIGFERIKKGKEPLTENLDEGINCWVEDKAVDIIDIKYQKQVVEAEGDLYLLTSALILYNE